MKVTHFSATLFLSICFWVLLGAEAKQGQADGLNRLMQSRKNHNPTIQTFSVSETKYNPVYITADEGSIDGDRLGAIPGQPNGVDFNQYAGYVTVDPTAGRALFYYFVESPENSSTNPLVLWLNGGPGCSSFGVGAMTELGPFRVNADGSTLFQNPYGWHNVANMIFLESPAGVGFSYSNTTSDYNITGDTTTANDAYAFLINWLERFPQYKSRDFYITGESYAGHYAPQLALTILANNENTNQTVINLKGIAIGNALVRDSDALQGRYEYLWTHALNSKETHHAIFLNCDFVNMSFSDQCDNYQILSEYEAGDIDYYNIYAPLCLDPSKNKGLLGSVDNYDPCSDNYVEAYLNTPEVQTAFHVMPTSWSACRNYNWTDWPLTILPVIQNLINSDLRVWMYSGDTDAVVPVTSTRLSIDSLNLPVTTPWVAWYNNDEVGGYVEQYEGLTFITVRGSGHMVPTFQPERSLTMISSFLQGALPPTH